MHSIIWKLSESRLCVNLSSPRTRHQEEMNGTRFLLGNTPDEEERHQLLSKSEARYRTVGWVGDLVYCPVGKAAEESLSQSHLSGSFIHSCLPEAGLLGVPATPRCWLQVTCGQHGLGVPGQAGPGGEAEGCGGVLVHGGRAAMAPACDGARGRDAADPVAWWRQAALLQRISETEAPSGSSTAPPHTALPFQEFVF